jgi:RluA family pseudouridine synthase
LISFQNVLNLIDVGMVESNHQVKSDEAGLKLRQLLRNVTGLSSKQGNVLIDRGQVKLNGKIERFGSIVLKTGQKISWQSEGEAKATSVLELKKNLNDKDFVLDNSKYLVLKKPPGIPSQRTKDPKRINAEDLVDRWAKAKGYGRVILTHRLDRDTSGLLLFAKNEKMATIMTEWFKHREINKTYFALCHGVTKPARGAWSHFLGKGIEVGGRQTYRVVRSGGQRAETDFEILQSGSGYSLWKLSPKTGRTHQLRVQLKEAGFPIVGDDLYGPRQAKGDAPHHLLHAGELLLPPESGLMAPLSAPFPSAFVEFCDRLGFTHLDGPDLA